MNTKSVGECRPSLCLFTFRELLMVEVNGTGGHILGLEGKAREKRKNWRQMNGDRRKRS